MNIIIGALGVLFVGLKLTGYIDWSWWLVTLPFWGGLALAAGIFIIGCLAVGSAAVLSGTKPKLTIRRK